MKPFILALGLLAAVSSSALAKPWSLQSCSTGGAAAQARAEYRTQVESAAPDTPLYTPHPYPTTDDQVIEDFLDYHLRAFSQTPVERIPEADRRLLDVVQSGDARYEVFDVSNWTPLRCGDRKSREIFHVIRIFDRTTDKELARVSVDDAGHVARLRHKPTDQTLAPIPSLAETVASVRARTGLKPVDAEYIATWGTPGCDEVSPCIALRNAQQAFVTRGPQRTVFRFETAGPGISLSKDLTPEKRGQVLLDVKGHGQGLLSVGADVFRRVVPVEASTGR